MIAEDFALGFGLASTTLYLGWSVAYLFTPQKHMAVVTLFYAGANIGLLWPLIGPRVKEWL